MLNPRRVALATLLCAVLAAPSRSAEPDRYLPDDSEIVLHVNVTQLLGAPIVQKHCLALLKGYFNGKAEVQTTLDALGFDPFRDVTSLTAASPSAGDSDKVFVIVRGKFEVAKFHAKAEEVVKTQPDHLKIHTAGANKIYEVRDASLGEDKPLYVALLDGTTLVASGAKDAIAEAFARAAGQKAATLKKEVRELIAAVNDKQSIWLVAPGAPLSKSEYAGDDRARKSLEKIAALTAGIAVNESLQAEIAITSKSAEDAKSLADELREGLEQAKGLIQVLAGNQSKLTPLVALLGSIQTNTTGTVTTLKAEVTVELLAKLLKQE